MTFGMDGLLDSLALAQYANYKLRAVPVAKLFLFLKMLNSDCCMTPRLSEYEKNSKWTPCPFRYSHISVIFNI